MRRKIDKSIFYRCLLVTILHILQPHPFSVLKERTLKIQINYQFKVLRKLIITFCVIKPVKL